MAWHDEYPHELHANVLLLDGKIEGWKVGNTKADEGYWPFKSYWKVSRMKLVQHETWDEYVLGDYTVKTKTWIVNNDQEHSDVFHIHAPEWFKQWEHADDYRLSKSILGGNMEIQEYKYPDGWYMRVGQIYSSPYEPYHVKLTRMVYEEDLGECRVFYQKLVPENHKEFYGRWADEEEYAYAWWFNEGHWDLEVDVYN